MPPGYIDVDFLGKAEIKVTWILDLPRLKMIWTV
jgi:hypothetical protein